MTLVLSLLLAGAAPAAPGTILGELGRSGEALIEAGDGRGTRDRVLEIMAPRCIVTFKTAIDARGFTAKIIDLGRGSKVERQADGSIILRGSTEWPGTLILHPGNRSAEFFDALQRLRDTCQTADEIF